ncbi:MATE family efflux transporter [Enterovibrio nigricans]|uniref:Multidrug export protein MepA n=1 Tax=Enterovibrio nigricans DSM 22720 TaxID=1121868 RepID=A0A1T4VVY5_9GAMM|nr:MATE family efflux transporter [Enterovibrio nigricans]PKF49282.1 multidrug efflux protein [Enterovibrio nigricans]SKA69174.1 putative efflux protein, MATE family [Enterovibrio nigricans DSM 22720]
MHINDLNPNASITKTFWRFTIPAIAAMIVNGLYYLVDGIFIGHFVGAEGLKAINIAWPVISIIGGSGLMIGMGTGSLISIYRGEEKLAAARNAMTTGLLLTAIFGALSSIYILFLGKTLVDLQGATGLAQGYAVDYLNVFIFGSIATVAASALPFFIRNDDSPIVATSMMVVGALSNIAMNYVFIGVLKWGLEGAAIGTVVAQLISIAMALGYLASKSSYLSIFKHPLRSSVKDAKQTIVLGSSSLAMFMYYGVLVAFHNKLFVEYGSNVSVAAFAVVGYLMTLYYVVAEGIAEGMQPQVSFYHGAKQYNNIVKVAKLATLVSLIAGVLWLAVLNVFPDVVIGMFNSGNDALINEATTGIRIHLSAMYLDGLIILASMYFLSVGKGGTSLAISLSNMFIQLPFLAILPKLYGLNGVWMSMPLSNVVLASIVLPIMWHHILKQRTVPQSPELVPA